MSLWDSFVGGVGDFIGGMPFGGGGGSMNPMKTMELNPSLSTNLMKDNLTGTEAVPGVMMPNFQNTADISTSAYTTPSTPSIGSVSGGGSLFGDTFDNLWGGLTNEQFTNLLNTGGRLWSVSNQSKALEGMKQALEQQQRMAEDAYNRYVAEQEKRQQLNF